MGVHFIGSSADSAQPKLSEIISSLGLSSGLQTLLDAGDAASYTSGQKWLDISGNGQDFILGATTGAEGSDPTFSGTPGAQTEAEHFALDGGDNFIYDGANETWMENIHKNNAKFTLLAVVKLASVSIDAQTICATYRRGEVATRGFGWYCFNNSLRFNVDNDPVFNFNFDASLSVGWNFCCISLDEATGAGAALARVNGNTSSKDATYTSPSASAASGVMRLGSNTTPNFYMNAGAKFGKFAAWSGVALSAAQQTSLYNALRPTYGF